MSPIFRIDDPATGRENMAQDLAMHEGVSKGAIVAGLRLYTWNPWCVSLGKHQSVDALNHDAIRDLGLDVVHRPTGGRAVLHAEEVTYCICVTMPDASRAQLVYAAVHDMLYRVLSALAPTLTHASLSSDLRTHYSSQQPIGQACFSSHAKSEILWKDRKVVGSAQRVMDGVLLQHGSILCEQGHEKLAHVIARNHDEAAKISGLLLNTSATLSEAAGHTISKLHVCSHFETQRELIAEELSAISQLARGEAR